MCVCVCACVRVHVNIYQTCSEPSGVWPGHSMPIRGTSVAPLSDNHHRYPVHMVSCFPGFGEVGESGDH